MTDGTRGESKRWGKSARGNSPIGNDESYVLSVYIHHPIMVTNNNDNDVIMIIIIVCSIRYVSSYIINSYYDRIIWYIPFKRTKIPYSMIQHHSCRHLNVTIQPILPCNTGLFQAQTVPHSEPLLTTSRILSEQEMQETFPRYLSLEITTDQCISLHKDHYIRAVKK